MKNKITLLGRTAGRARDVFYFCFLAYSLPACVGIGKVPSLLVAKRIWWQCFGCLLQYGSPGSGWRHLNAKWRSPRYYLYISTYIYIYITIHTICYITLSYTLLSHINRSCCRCHRLERLNPLSILLFARDCQENCCVSREEMRTKAGWRY